jgi:deoxyribodipyrimidine photolyase-related protein
MTLRLLLGDQLNSNHSWFDKLDDSVCYLLMEVQQETNYVTHHIQKVVAFFNAMRQFKVELENRGHRVHYMELNHQENKQNIPKNLLHLIEVYKATKFEYQFPDEYRLDQQLSDFCNTLSIESKAIDTEHFMTSRTFLTSFFEGKKQLVMEYFYRRIRKDFNLLMEGEINGREHLRFRKLIKWIQQP